MDQRLQLLQRFLVAAVTGGRNGFIESLFGIVGGGNGVNGPGNTGDDQEADQYCAYG